MLGLSHATYQIGDSRCNFDSQFFSNSYSATGKAMNTCNISGMFIVL